MANGTIDTLKLADKFTAAGFEEKAAHTLAETFGEFAGKQMVTREYLDYKLEAELSKVKYDLIKWLLPILLGQVAVFAVIVEFLLKR